jgi:hypothetical protein
MPAEQRFVMEEESSGLRSGFQLAEAGKERSIRWPHGRAGHLPAEDGNLVTEHDDLDGQIGLVRPSQEEDLDGPEEGDIEEREGHGPFPPPFPLRRKSQIRDPG